MKLLDAANVNPASALLSNNRWLGGYNAVARACSVHMDIEDPCDAEGLIELIGDEDARKSNYWVQPYAIRSFLRQSVQCEQEDDDKWLDKALQSKLEWVVSRSLVQKFADKVETWIGDAGVQTVALAGSPTDAQVLAAVIAGRKLWEETVVDPEGGPIMHVPPSLAPSLFGKVLMPTGPEEVASVWGDKVVVTSGYEYGAAPRIFFSGEVIVRLTGIDDEGGPLYQARLNNYTLSTNQFAAVDVAPCSIVRVGS